MLLNLLWKYLLAYMQPAHTVLAFFYRNGSSKRSKPATLIMQLFHAFQSPIVAIPPSTVVNKPSLARNW